MSWMQRLYETYEQCAGSDLPDAGNLYPIAHTKQLAQVEIVVDPEGKFRRASLISKDEVNQPCLIPATEKSAGRTSGEAPHPLCDKIQYCAGDYEAFGGSKDAYFDSYVAQLNTWCTSSMAHEKAAAILLYVSKRTTVRDLVEAGVLVADTGRLVVYEKSGSKASKSEESLVPGIFALLTAKKDGNRMVVEQGDAFVRWRVESANSAVSGTWEDSSLIDSWQKFAASQQTKIGMCLVKGESCILAEQHPSKLRHGADKAKIVSSNDSAGFTFRGRFVNPDQAAGISFDATQKIHSALRWLISRKQAFRNGDQVIVSWALRGQAIPDPWANTMELFGGAADDGLDVGADSVGDFGQSFSIRLNQAIAGYKSTLDDSEAVMVMGLDSATPGRMAVTFYKELKGSTFLDRIEHWHASLSWFQDFGKKRRFVGAPAPRDIAEAAYGQRIDDKLKKATVERLLPCIIDRQNLPRDLVELTVRRVVNRIGMKGKKGQEWNEWEKCLGIVCSLFKGLNHQKGYAMALEESRKTRDYLYGRLLAVAEHIEARSLYVAGENRDTMASRLMQRFADHPHSTWRTIELSLKPYMSRLRSSRGAFLASMENLLDGIIAAFSHDDLREAFVNDTPLSGEFLLGYHCQRQTLRSYEKPDDLDTTKTVAEEI